MIVGAGSSGPGWGNGKATAVACAREGAKVFCVDVNHSAAEETANIIMQEGGLALPFRADVTKDADVEAMVLKTLRAGVTPKKPEPVPPKPDVDTEPATKPK